MRGLNPPWRLAHTFFTTAVLQVACGGGSESGGPGAPPPPPAAVATVDVSPATAQLLPAQTSQLSAQPRDAAGNALSGRVVTWSSSNQAIATVAGTGLVTAVAAGSATITATSEGQAGSATITVLAPVASISLSDTALALVPGAADTIVATLRNAAGDTLLNRTIQWTSSAPTVATVSANGVIAALAVGSTRISASVEGKNAEATVSVRSGGVVQASGTSRLATADSALVIEVPAGAAPPGLRITIEADTVPPAAPAAGTWRMGKQYFALGPDGTRFAQPVTVRLRYDPQALPAWVVPGDLGIQRWDGTRWNALANVVVDTVAKVISGQTLGFSTFNFVANLPPVNLTPVPAQVNYNQRFVRFTAAIPGHPSSAFRYRWATTGSNGTLIDLFSDDRKEYLATTGVIPDGVIDLVGVEVSAQQSPGGPYVPVANATTGIDSNLGLTFELNPWSQKVGFRQTTQVDAVVRERTGSVYSSPDLYYEYTYTQNAGDFSPPKATRTNASRASYTSWSPSRQVPDPPRGEKLTVKFLVRQSVWSGDMFGRNSITYNFHEIGTADAFVEIGADTWVPRFDVLTIPTPGGACVVAVLYIKKVPGTPRYDLFADGFNLSGMTTFTRSWTAATGTTVNDIVDLGSQWRVGITSGCATTSTAITFRENLYRSTFANIQAEVKAK